MNVPAGDVHDVSRGWSTEGGAHRIRVKKTANRSRLAQRIRGLNFIATEFLSRSRASFYASYMQNCTLIIQFHTTFIYYSLHFYYSLHCLETMYLKTKAEFYPHLHRICAVYSTCQNNLYSGNI